MIHPQCEEESLTECPQPINMTVELGNRLSDLHMGQITSGLLQQFCITSNTSSRNDVAWKLKDVTLNNCRHEMPR